MAAVLRLWKPVGLVLLLLGLLFMTSSWVHLEVPAPTGGHHVGRQQLLWTDPVRAEPRTANAEDNRQVGLIVWYPAEAGTGSPADYVPDLDRIRAGLIESGELSSIEVAGLRWVRSNSHDDASIHPGSSGYPLLILSPGNATNVEFYGSIGEDLASHGYVVVGLNHPYQVTSMALGDGSTAVYDESPDTGPGRVEAKIEERVADVEFVLDRLGQEIGKGGFLGGRVDLNRIGILGHSNGGLTAAEMCRRSAILVCMNIDGQAASGPFGTAAEPSPVGHPFMFLTKEAEIHPLLAATFEESGPGTFRVVVPAASHEQFADGPLFRPGVWPFDRVADRVHLITRGFARAFFDRYLIEGAGGELDVVAAPTDVYLYGYPLDGNRDR